MLTGLSRLRLLPFSLLSLLFRSSLGSFLFRSSKNRNAQWFCGVNFCFFSDSCWFLVTRSHLTNQTGISRLFVTRLRFLSLLAHAACHRPFIPLLFLCFFRPGKTLQKRIAEGTERHCLPVHNPRIFSSFALSPSLSLSLVSFLRSWYTQFVHLFLFLVSPSSRRWCMTGFHSLSLLHCNSSAPTPSFSLSRELIRTLL